MEDGVPRPLRHAKIIPATGGISLAKPEDETYTAKELIVGLGGPFELLHPPSATGAVLVVRREWIGLPFNVNATRIMSLPGDPVLVFGPALLVHSCQI